jgi:hypothetical protein
MKTARETAKIICKKSPVSGGFKYIQTHMAKTRRLSSVFPSGGGRNCVKESSQYDVISSFLCRRSRRYFV